VVSLYLEVTLVIDDLSSRRWIIIQCLLNSLIDSLGEDCEERKGQQEEGQKQEGGMATVEIIYSLALTLRVTGLLAICSVDLPAVVSPLVRRRGREGGRARGPSLQ
jgi:hypothetical protein